MVEQLTLQTIGILLTAVTVSIAAIYYIMTLRNQNISRQLQILQGANILGDHVWILQVEFSDFDDWWDRYGFDKNPEFRKMFLDYFNQLEELGVYVKEGLLDVRYLVMLGGYSIIGMWELYAPIHEGLQRRFGGDWFVEAEYLYKEVKEYFRKHPELKT